MAAAEAEPGTSGIDLGEIVTCAEAYTVVSSGPRKIVAMDFDLL